MRAILLGAILCACGTPDLEDSLVCEGALCAHVAPGVEVTFSVASIPGAPEGDWLAVEGGPALLVFSTDPPTSLEIHGVRVDGEIVFDVIDASEGVEPQLGVRPTGEPPTLLAPPGNVEVLLRSARPVEITVARFVRTGPGGLLAVDLRILDDGTDPDRVEAAMEEAAAILGLELDCSYVPVSDEERAAALAGEYQPTVLASLGQSSRASVSLLLVPQLAAGVIGTTTSTPLSPLRGDGAIAIDAALAGDALGRTFAHEIGHALGLLHVSEEDGWQVEALSDTATCLVDTTGDGRRGAEDCPEAATNLMFWDRSGGGVVLTEMQRARMMGSPLLR